MSLCPDLKKELLNELAGEVKDDAITRVLYSTDASIYQIEPLGVVFPRNQDDLCAIVSSAKKYQTPVLARGAGSSIAGQAIGESLIIDFSKYLKNINEINYEERTAIVEPGVVLDVLNRKAGQQGLVFGPDPASADRATIGGSIGNNASGAHSIQYGMMADHVLSMDVILSDGNETTFCSKRIEDIEKLYINDINSKNNGSVEQRLYQTALKIRNHHKEIIKKNFPLVWRRASGYNINYLLPWSPAKPEQWEMADHRPYPPIEKGTINLAPLITGSEGTLAIIKSVKLNLVSKAKHKILGVLSYENIVQACDAVQYLLKFIPSAIELIPGELIQLARSVPAYARQLTFIRGNPSALLVIEFSGDNPQELLSKTKQIREDVLIAESDLQQSQVWNIRKMGLGILNSTPGDQKPYGFIEDLAVPVEKLSEFVRGMLDIFSSFHIHANIYAHASAGCLHIRPIISLKEEKDVIMMRNLAKEAVDLTISLGGAISGEHGDGMARSEWIERAFGNDIYQLFCELKNAADEDGLFNPGKKINAPPMNINLRYGDGYKPKSWQPNLDFSRQEGLIGAVEMCNGAGVCRKDTGLMCPSYQVLHDEMHSTRGRSNLLRALISGKIIKKSEAEEAVHEALDTCLACKGCKSECPSSVDIAKLKYDFFYQYYKTHKRRLRDYLFGYIHIWSKLGSYFAPMINTGLKSMQIRRLNEYLLGLAAKREFPYFASIREKRKVKTTIPFSKPDVLILLDTFSHSFNPEIEFAAIKVLEKIGEHPFILPVIGAGRSMISKSFLDEARKHASKLIDAIKIIDPQGVLPVIGVEPSEIFTLRDEFLDLLPKDEYVEKLSRRAWMIDEYMIRPGQDGEIRINKVPSLLQVSDTLPKVLLHGQCYQKAQFPGYDGFPTGVMATITMLESAGYRVEMIESGCCGMAGAFGYEAEHYDLSMKIGELSVFPKIRSAEKDVIIAACGTSCRSQIKNGTEKIAKHPIQLIIS